jgi:hypothetical protein
MGDPLLEMKRELYRGILQMQDALFLLTLWSNTFIA